VELLSEILALVVPDISLPEIRMRRVWDRPSKITESPFHCVRSSCRTFRWIVDELPFWHADDFNINQLFDWQHKAQPHSVSPSVDETSDSSSRSPSSLSSSSSERSVYCPYLGVVVSDPHLQPTLVRKKSWFVANAVLFEQLTHAIPGFGRRVQSLTLYGNGYHDYSWGYVTTNLFEKFPVLTDLQVESNDHVCLKFLPKTLQKLRMDAPLIEDCDCRMDFPHLELLHYFPLDHEIPLDFDRMLPFNSKNTLRELSFNYPTPWPPPIDDEKDSALLYQFENLTTLFVAPLSSELCRSLRQSPLRLKHFRSLTFFSDELFQTGALVDLLNSPVCANMESLQFEMRIPPYNIFGPTVIDDDRRNVYEPLVRTVATLPRLEKLGLQYPLHPTWIQHFRASSRLKRLDWNQQGFWFKDECDDVLEEDLLEILEKFGDGRQVKISGSRFTSDDESESEGEETDRESDWETVEELEGGDWETGEESEGGETHNNEEESVEI
jgi:hypothetical protein